MDSDLNSFSWRLARNLADYSGQAYTAATVSDAKTNAQALVTFNADGDLIVAFKGSSAPRDFMQDAKFMMRPLGQGVAGLAARIHAGFLEDFTAIVDATVQAVKSGLAMHGLARVLVTGHSLGGALAILGALELHRQNLPVSAVYTFGQPRVGDGGFRTHYDMALRPVTYRVVNQNDIVPRTPGWLMGYRHCGQEMFLPVGGGGWLNPALPRKLLSDAMGLIVAYHDREEVLITDHYLKSYQQAMLLAGASVDRIAVGDKPLLDSRN